MSNAANDRRIDYIEFPALDAAKSKEFYATVFGWKFEDYGPTYTSFHDGRLAGGFAADPAERALKAPSRPLCCRSGGSSASRGTGPRIDYSRDLFVSWRAAVPFHRPERQ
jgi:catechol 2,3-dioxygenase-like lactoylglutathione lyase family enzyme